jgi:hypothetical protein
MNVVQPIRGEKGATPISLDVLFAQSDRVDIHAGASGVGVLVAYTGGSSIPHLLERFAPLGFIDAAKTVPKSVRVETNE